MRLSKPAYGLDFLTAIWLVYAVLNFWWFPDWRLSLFGALLFCGMLSSVGIWLNFRPSGYLFAFANIAASVLAVMLVLGYLVPDRPFSWNSIFTILVPLYCVWAGTKWAMAQSPNDSESAG